MAGRRVVKDVSEPNWGTWRHDIAKYLAGGRLRNDLRAMLGMPAEELTPRRLSDRVSEAPVPRRPSRARAVVTYRTIEKVVSNALAAKAGSRATRPGKRRGKSTIETISRPDREAAQPEAVVALRDALREVRLEADREGDVVMTSPMDRGGALLQSKVSEMQGGAASVSSDEFPFDSQDTKAVLKQFFDDLQHITPHAALRPQSSTPEPLPESARLFLVSDFGTGLYGAPVIAETIAQQQFDVLLHMGDIYYSGQKAEVQHRFLDIWPVSAGMISRTLNGNHDMYSGGYGYFDVALPAFSQPSSYFAFKNKHWLLLMLDTAYADNNLDDDQVAWIDEVIAGAGQRRVILFSHHPLFSNFKPQGTQLAAKLSDHLSEQSITAWYWGHEHHAVIYEADLNFGFLGRCLGNGGMPAKRKNLNDLPVEKQIGDFVWRRCNSPETPPALYLDGPNPYITEAPSMYVPHGYMTLEFAGDTLTERVFSAEGEELYRNVIG
jgi:hypothetical protein